jgi:DNA polymerase zeta
MVQSLIAIWEVCFLLRMCSEKLLIAESSVIIHLAQEVECLRLLEETKSGDLGRPSWEAVLKNLLHGIKYESALSMLFPQEGSHHIVSTIEESERLEKCFKSLTDIVGTVTFSQDDYCDDISVAMGMQNERKYKSVI